MLNARNICNICYALQCIALHCLINYLLLLFSLLLYESSGLWWLVVSRFKFNISWSIFIMNFIFFFFFYFLSCVILRSFNEITYKKSQSETNIFQVTLVILASIITKNVYDSKWIAFATFHTNDFQFKFFGRAPFLGDLFLALRPVEFLILI